MLNFVQDHWIWYIHVKQNPKPMQHIQGEDRDQMFMFSLESTVPADGFVRVVDAFVDAIDLKSFGFKHVECNEEGRPPYHPSIQ